MTVALEGISRTSAKNVFSASWWFEPFGIELTNVLKRLPDAIPASERAKRSFAGGAKACLEPAAGEQGFVLVWPDQSGGLASLITLTPARDMELLGCWPFVRDGIEHRVRIDEVVVDERALEGVIRGSIGSALLDWHDPFFAVDRDLYGLGSVHQVAFAGFAHDLNFGAPPSVIVREGDPSYALLKDMNPAGVRKDGAIELRTEGMAALLPSAVVMGFCEFQGPVTSIVRQEERFLARTVWRLTVTVARLEKDEAVDIVVLVSDVVLNGRDPPQVGDDVGGHLRLQGVIVRPNLQDEA